MSEFTMDRCNDIARFDVAELDAMLEVFDFCNWGDGVMLSDSARDWFVGNVGELGDDLQNVSVFGVFDWLEGVLDVRTLRDGLCGDGVIKTSHSQREKYNQCLLRLLVVIRRLWRIFLLLCICLCWVVALLIASNGK